MPHPPCSVVPPEKKAAGMDDLPRGILKRKRDDSDGPAIPLCRNPGRPDGRFIDSIGHEKVRVTFRDVSPERVTIPRNPEWTHCGEALPKRANTEGHGGRGRDPILRLLDSNRPHAQPSSFSGLNRRPEAEIYSVVSRPPLVRRPPFISQWMNEGFSFLMAFDVMSVLIHSLQTLD